MSPPVQGPCDAPFLLVRAGALRPGPAVTVATSGALLDGPVALEGLGAASSLRAERIGEAMGYRVVLDGADGAWTLVEHAETDDGQPTLLWAGDLDGDGRLDLLLNQTPKYSYQLVGLYLSSAATEGPVALVDEITVVTD